MKRLIITVVICALAGSLHAQTYGLPARLDSLRGYALSAAGMPAGHSDLVDSVMNKLVNLSILRVCKDFPAIQKYDTVVLAKSSQGVALNSDFLVATDVQRIIGEGIRISLEPIAPGALVSLYEKIPKDSMAADPLDVKSPRYWTEHNDKLFFHPKYNKASAVTDSFLVFYEAMDSVLQVDASTTQIHEKYRDALIDLIVFRIWMRFGELSNATIAGLMYNSHGPRTPVQVRTQ